MISSIISRIVILVFGTLYPAYASYKAVKTKNAREYVKWMMYWIVFAFFTCTETFTDIFLSWFPFYYEIKILLVIWLLSPATNGSSILYRKFVHPTLSKREEEIDEYIERAKVQSYRQVLDLGSKGVTVLMQTAIKSIKNETLIATVMQSNAQENSPTDDRTDSNETPTDSDSTVPESLELKNNLVEIQFSDDEEPFLMPLEAKPAKKKGRAKKATNVGGKRATRQTRTDDMADDMSDF